MFARHRLIHRNNPRRGIVLVLILGMLALLALIGVTFASISGQALVSSRKYAESLLIPDARKMFDYGLNQLVNDTQNPLSAMFGHSLLRDMYGNDGNDNGGPLATTIQTVNLAPNRLVIQTTTPAYTDGNGVARLMAPGEYGKSPIGWVLKASAPGFVSMSLEIVAADIAGNQLRIYTHLPDADPSYAILTDPNYQLLNIMAQPGVAGVSTVLDGRYMRAFNGAGQTSYALAQAALIGNPLYSELYRLPNHFRSGLASSLVNNQVPVDEDYDACDLENMFLAIESADSSIVIPSFHRPGIVRYQVNPANPTGPPLLDDWTNLDTINTTLTPAQRLAMSSSRFLRPRLVDHPTSGLKDLRPDPVTGKIEYDVDNDGDGVTDSVWIDLGFPPQRDANGKLYKPMFAFKVIGLNGKLPLNTAGNVQARSLRDQNGPDLNSDGIPDGDNLPDNEPLWDHASHLGYSVNEINPKYALQNHPDSPQADNTGDAYNTAGIPNIAGVPVNVTQLRNLLMGTRPMPAPDQPVIAGTPNWDIVNGIPFNGDSNTVVTGSRTIRMPNNVPDAGDASIQSMVFRNVPPVPGLWGEEQGVPRSMPADNVTLTRTAADLNVHPLIPAINASNYAILPNNTYYSRVGPGRSPALIDYMPPSGAGSPPYTLAPYPLYSTDIDGTNDSYSTYDFVPGTVGTAVGAELGNLADTYAVTTMSSTYALEFPNLPSERFRSFVKPVDVSGNGLMGKFYTVPMFNYDPLATAYAGPQFGGLNNTNGGTRSIRGYGPDQWGRVSYFNYYRPPGVPFYVDTRAVAAGGVFTPRPIIPDANADANYLNDPITATRHNLYNGYESARMPRAASRAASSGNRTDFADAFLGVMPYNFSDQAITQNPATNPNYNSSYPAIPADSGWTAGGPTSLAPTFLIDPNSGSYLGTFDNQINSLDTTKALVYSTINGSTYSHPTIYGSMPAYNPPSNPNGMGPDPYPGGSLGRDLAHEVNLYHPDSTDRPYTNADLEWLYRQQDVDGAHIDSRLKYLAPVSFVYSPDAPMRRKMFSVETWELNNFTWAYDNPAGVFPNNTLFAPAVNGSASIVTLNSNPYIAQISPGLTASYINTGGVISTPAYAHRNRKINLNAPFPVTNDPDDPVRKKWVYDTYQALKQVLPPKSLDTPEELLALSQYVVNIVDSRDPDAAMTHFINPDVRQTPPVLGDPTTNPPTPPIPPVLVMSTSWNGSAYVVNPAFANALPISQYGMENQPIAINEALAYRFYRRNNSTTNPTPTNLPTPRFWLELVNTLTQGQQGNAGQVDPANWEILIAPDDSWGRPNPFTGQINFDPSQAANGQPLRKGNPNDTAAQNVAWPKSWRIPSSSANLPALRIDTDSRADDTPGYYYVVGMETPSDDANGTANPPPRLNITQYPLEAGMPGPDTAIETGNVAQTYFGADPGEEHPAVGAATTPTFPNGGIAPTRDQASPSNLVSIRATIPAKNKNATPPRYGYLFDADDDNDQIPDASPGAYYWVYLRRPANPLDPTSAKVVVDSIRIPYVENTSNGSDNGQDVQVNGGRPVTSSPVTKNNAVEASAFEQAMYSLARLQPYRGGQLIPTLPALDSSTPPNLVTTSGQADYRYGYTEQHFYTYRQSNLAGGESATFGLGLFSKGRIAAAYTSTMTPMTQVPMTDRIYHSLGRANTYPGTNDKDEYRLPTILDRDFMNVVELTNVPASPPGLFTKQFIETPVNPLSIGGLPNNWTNPNPNQGSPNAQFPFTGATTPVSGGSAPTRVALGPPWTVPRGGQRDGDPIPSTTIPVYPYLADQFFYTAANSNFFWDPVNDTFVYDNFPVNPNAAGPPVANVGGASGAGWHKMFELFEVPSTAMGSIGPVSQGMNFDWYREDRRPGQINLNLIVDEEVFFGLIDDETVAKLNKQEMSTENGVPVYPPYAPAAPNASTVPAVPPGNFPSLALPRIVTQVDANGFPTYTVDGNGTRWTGSYAMNNRGFTRWTPATGPYYQTDPQDDSNGVNYPLSSTVTKPALMKAAFADFLKLRHGGSGFLFSYGIGTLGGLAPVGSGPVGPLPDISSGGITTTPAMDRPFHSLSYPDIDYTVMRPATLPPSAITDQWTVPPRGVQVSQNMVAVPPTPLLQPDDPGQPIGTAPFFPANSNYTLNGFAFVGDPGVKTAARVETDAEFNGGARTPLIEPFPGRPSNPAPGDFASAYRRNWMPPPTPPRRLFQLSDATATLNGNNSEYVSNASDEGDLRYFDDSGTLRTAPRSQLAIVHPTLYQPESDLVSKFDASNTLPNPLKLGGYRAVMNTDGTNPIPDRRQLPAFRNEWLQKVVNLSTVRTHQYAVWLTVGFFEVAQAGDPANLIPDQLGPEIGLSSGQNVRFRGFFVLDRTLANGFDPNNPADFRRVVTHWRRIE